MEIRAMSVSEVNSYIKRFIDTDPILSGITVKGEISNFKLHSSGHMYFSLKDSGSRLRCIMFRSNSDGLSFIPEDGKKVVAKGSISVYERDGQYQLYVKHMTEDGKGELYAAFETLKRKLELLGYFDVQRKKRLPFIPRRIGVVTSARGAAIRDIISVIERRFGKLDIVVYDSLVQGPNAPAQICRGIEYFNLSDPVDVIIVGRGGGSIEELWAFNDEDVAHAIYRSEVPVVSAVGHQTDFTIADFVADLRAPTPTAAAEMVVPDIREVTRQLEGYCNRMKSVMLKSIEHHRERLRMLKGSYGLRRPVDRIEQLKQQVDEDLSRMTRAMTVTLAEKKQALERNGAHINSLSPIKSLERGYSVIRNLDTGRMVKNAADVKVDNDIRIRIIDAIIDAKVVKVKRGSGLNI
jgi:exodeoxyribonuclease VII large subunit